MSTDRPAAVEVPGRIRLSRTLILVANSELSICSRVRRSAPSASAEKFEPARGAEDGVPAGPANSPPISLCVEPFPQCHLPSD